MGEKNIPSAPGGLWSILDVIERYILIITLLTMTISVTVAVILRYLTISNFFGLEELLGLVGMWLFFIGGAYCSSANQHVNADILSFVLKSDRALKIRNVIVYLISLFTIAALAALSCQFFIWAIEVGRKSAMLKLPLYISVLPMLLGFALMFCYTLRHMIFEIRKEPDEKAPGSEKEVIER